MSSSTRSAHNRSTKTRRYRAALESLERLEPRLLMAGTPVTDYSVVTLPAAPTLPAKGGIFIDPAFGTKILRVTDTTDGNANNNIYSYYPALNKDNTRLAIMRNGAFTLYDFNATTMAVSNPRPLFASAPPGGWGMTIGSSSIWSSQNPNVIITSSGSKILAYDTSANTYTTIKDFAGTTGWATGDYIWQLSRSMDDQTFAFTRKNRTGEVYTDKGWQAWRNTGGAGTTLAQSNNLNLDEVQVDKSGNWLVEKFGDSSGDNMWNLNTGTFTFLNDGSPGYSPDHSDNGTGFIVAFENWNNNILKRNFSDPTNYTVVYDPPSGIWQSGHISMLADDEAWSMQSRQYSGTTAGAFKNELFLNSTDGTGRVIRFVHHRTDASSEYWHNSFPSISRDGKFVVFTSNWGTTRSDVFIARVPIRGDANMDYLVNQTDLDAYNANAGITTGGTWAKGDWNADGAVNSTDLALWTANQTNPGTPTVTISANDNAATEVAGNGGQYTITRSGGTGAALTVNITKSGTAVSGTDYTAIGNTVTIPVGASSVTLNLAPLQDSLIEATETTIITVASGTGYTVGSPSAGTVNITDDDKATITVAATDNAATETAGNTGLWTFTRTGTYQGTAPALTINYAISGTATNTSDYGTLSGTVSFAAGATTATVTLTPVDDSAVESTETAILTISANANYTVGSPSAGTVNITDNDVAVATNAADDFNYTAFSGANGGTGWSGPWAVTNTTNTGTTAGSLLFATGGHTLATSGNRVWTTQGETASRNTGMSFGVDGTSRWVGFLVNSAFSGGTSATLGGQIELGNQLFMGANFGSNWSMRAVIGTNEYYATSNVPVVANTTTLIVARIDYGATDTVRLWVNPTPGVQPTDASANATLSTASGVSFASGNQIKLNAGSYWTKANFDELRYGTTYGAVAPEVAVSTPAAASNLVATPGTTSIGLTWTDNSSNETGFKIWRSTDNATWGSPIQTTAAGATSYTDSTVTQGTGYFYKVAATNGGGDSASTGMTSARATVLASDSFPGATLNGANGGVGWSNAWSVTNTTNTGVTTPGLTYTNAGHALVSSGNAIWTWQQESASRNVSTSYGTDGTSRWVGFLLNAGFQGGTYTVPGGELDLGAELKIGATFNNTFGLRATFGANEYFAASSITPPVNTTTLIVARVDYGTTDVVRMWINPMPGVQPADSAAAATLTLPAGVSFSVGSQIKVHGGSYWTKATFDEIRYGLSYVAVAPDPLVADKSIPKTATAKTSTFTGPTHLASWTLPTTPVRQEQVNAVTVRTGGSLSMDILTSHLDWSSAMGETHYLTYGSDEALDEKASEEEVLDADLFAGEMEPDGENAPE
jgi:hypothetical protein